MSLKMFLKDVPIGMMVRVVGGAVWHPQAAVPGAIYVLRARSQDLYTFNLISILESGGVLKQYTTETNKPLENWTCNVTAEQAAQHEVEAVSLIDELRALFPNELWPAGFDARYIVWPRMELVLEGVVLSPESRKAIVSVLATHRKEVQELVFNKWGFSKTIEKGRGMALLFYGPPGTGKTKCAEAIAQDFGMKVKLIDPAMLWSSEPGSAERTIKGVFDHAQKTPSQLLLFDECEVLIADRGQTGQILAAQTNALLSALERYDGISIFTTNRTPVLDPAFERRLQLKLEFPKPDKGLREAIWRALTPKEAPMAGDVCFRTLAASELSGGHIKNVLLNAARRAASAAKEEIAMSDLLEALTDELNGMAAFAEEDTTPRLGGFGMTRSAGRGLEIKRQRSTRLTSGEELVDGQA